MNHTTIAKIAHKHDSSLQTFERLYQLLCTVLSFGLSTRYNCKYDTSHMINSLVALCTGNSYAESGLKRLAMESNLRKTPSGSWLLDAIKRIPENKMLLQLSDSLDSTILYLKSLGLFGKSITFAIDKHLIPRYDENPDQFLIKSKSQKGTQYFESYCTMQCVDDGMRVCLGAYHVTPNESMASFVRKLLSDNIRNGIMTHLVLLDREFFSTAVISELKKFRQTFLMPARKTSRIKDAIIEFAEGKRESVSQYVIRSSSGHVESFNLVILPNDNPKRSDISDQYLTFATNIESSKIIPSEILQEYHKRWGIETGYSCIEKLRPRTTSPNHSVRLMMFYFPLVFYNAWVIANFLLREEIDDINYKPIISIEMLKCFFRLFVTQMIRNEKCNYFLEYVG